MNILPTDYADTIEYSVKIPPATVRGLMSVGYKNNFFMEENTTINIGHHNKFLYKKQLQGDQ